MTKNEKEQEAQQTSGSDDTAEHEESIEAALEGEVIIGEGENEEEPLAQMKAENVRLKDALALEKEQSAKYLKHWQFAQADLQNYKKRIEKDMQAKRQEMKANSLRHYIEILDDIELALKNAGDDNGADWKKGIELIHRKMLGVLEKEGVTPIDSTGEFNPMVHEAVSSEPNPDVEPGHIIAVVQQGYQLGNRTLRPSRVRVAI